MGVEKYEGFVKRADSVLTYDPGWSEDNKTGAWRSLRPVTDMDKCNRCGMCWLFCPDGAIERHSYVINLTYCKGCGICATECKPGAIAMIPEGDAEGDAP